MGGQERNSRHHQALFQENLDGWFPEIQKRKFTLEKQIRRDVGLYQQEESADGGEEERIPAQMEQARPAEKRCLGTAEERLSVEPQMDGREQKRPVGHRQMELPCRGDERLKQRNFRKEQQASAEKRQGKGGGKNEDDRRLDRSGRGIAAFAERAVPAPLEIDMDSQQECQQEPEGGMKDKWHDGKRHQEKERECHEAINQGADRQVRDHNFSFQRNADGRNWFGTSVPQVWKENECLSVRDPYAFPVWAGGAESMPPGYGPSCGMGIGYPEKERLYFA